MRIAYLINQYPAISHSFIRREILALEAQGVEVLRYAMRGWDAELVDPRDQEEALRTRYTLKEGTGPLLVGALKYAARHPGAFARAARLALSMSRGAVRPWPYHLIYLAHACRIMTWLEGETVDHVHAHFGTNSTEIAALVQALGGPGYSFTVHGSEITEDARQNRPDAKLRDARFVAVVCKYIGSQVMRFTDPKDWDKIETIHCGLPDGSFADGPGSFPDVPTFLSVGRLSGLKGHLILLDAFAQVLQTRPEARLALAGDGPMRPMIEERIAALGIGKSVSILGWVNSDQVRDALRAAHVLVQPSFSEGLPVVIMEAMAQHRPVIATYVAGIPELVLPGENGWLVPAGDVTSLAEAMRDCAQSSDAQLAAFGAAGAARVRARHDVDKGAALLRAKFEEVSQP